MVRRFPGFWSRLIMGDWQTLPAAMAAKLFSRTVKGNACR